MRKFWKLLLVRLCTRSKPWLGYRPVECRRCICVNQIGGVMKYIWEVAAFAFYEAFRNKRTPFYRIHTIWSSREGFWMVSKGNQQNCRDLRAFGKFIRINYSILYKSAGLIREALKNCFLGTIPKPVDPPPPPHSVLFGGKNVNFWSAKIRNFI